MGTDNKNLIIEILAPIFRKTGSKVTFATANIFKAEFLENSMDAAEIIVDMTMYKMNMHNFRDLFSINNHKPNYFSMQR